MIFRQKDKRWVIRTPSRLRRTPPIAPFLFATEGELGCDSWENRGRARLRLLE